MERQIVFLYEYYPEYFKTANSSKLVHRTKKMSIKIIMEYIFEPGEIIQNFILKIMCVRTTSQWVRESDREGTESVAQGKLKRVSKGPLQQGHLPSEGVQCHPPVLISIQG